MRQLFFMIFLLTFSSSKILADEKPNIEECLQLSILTADQHMTIEELNQYCEELTQKQIDLPSQDPAVINQADQNPIATRLKVEALNRSNRFILTPHKRNFFNPVSHTRSPNEDPYQSTNSSFTYLDHTEAELQLSIKILLHEALFHDNGHLYLGYTNHSFWQVYSDNDSAPFRATDHQPEFILSFTNDGKVLGFRNSMNQFIINHQSNGIGGVLSRSWNRVMFTSIFERNNFVFSLTPWYRIPEPKQEYPGDPDGDDNPDITDYMGEFEFSSAYSRRKNIFSIILRKDFEFRGKGAIEFGWSFPLSNNIRGQLSYFNGYGHSLIDYNKDLEVFSLGILFTDLF